MQAVCGSSPQACGVTMVAVSLVGALVARSFGLLVDRKAGKEGTMNAPKIGLSALGSCLWFVASILTSGVAGAALP